MVNLNEEDYFAATTGGNTNALQTVVETRMESGRQTAGRRPGAGTGLSRGLSMGGLKMGGHHLETLSTLTLAGGNNGGQTNYPTFSEVARYKVGTVTPPPSNRWMSEESTPLFRPHGQGGDPDDDDDDEVEPYSLDDVDVDEETIEPGGVMTWRPKRQASGDDDLARQDSADEGVVAPTYIEPPRGFEGDTDLGTTQWNMPKKKGIPGLRLDAQQEHDRIEELWQIAASVIPPIAAVSPTRQAGQATTTTTTRPRLEPRRLPTWLPSILLPLAASLVIHPILYAASMSPTLPLPSSIQHLAQTLPPPSFPALEANIGFSIVAFLGMLYAVPWMGDAFVAKDLKGLDLLKGVHGTVIPESMGLPGAAGYIGLMIMFIPFPFSKYFEDSLNGWGSAGTTMEQAVGRRTFPHQELALFLSSILSLLIATLLGFLDDVFDIRWRHKLPIPIIASIPLLMVYYAEGGSTTVVMPIGARALFGNTVNLGPLYYIYMSLLSTFSTNGINILAGVNGLEVGQALVIALSVALNDALYLPIWPRLTWGSAHVLLEGGPVLRRGSEELIQRHLLSLYFMGPLIGVCLGLLYHNWWVRVSTRRLFSLTTTLV